MLVLCPPISALYSKFSCGPDQSQAAWSSAAASAVSASEELFVWRAAQLGVFDRHLKFEFLTENQKSDPSFKTISKDPR